jgi:hypothetical protein
MWKQDLQLIERHFVFIPSRNKEMKENQIWMADHHQQEKRNEINKT